MLVCRYSNRGELELEGDSSGLLAICRILRPTEIGTLKISLDKADYRPYDGLLDNLLVISARGQPVKIFRESYSLRIVGDAYTLDLLAQNIEFLLSHPRDADGTGSHLHVEYYEGHPWLDSSSEPLVVSLILSSEEFRNM